MSREIIQQNDPVAEAFNQKIDNITVSLSKIDDITVSLSKFADIQALEQKSMAREKALEEKLETKSMKIVEELKTEIADVKEENKRLSKKIIETKSQDGYGVSDIESKRIVETKSIMEKFISGKGGDSKSYEITQLLDSRGNYISINNQIEQKSLSSGSHYGFNAQQYGNALQDNKRLPSVEETIVPLNPFVDMVSVVTDNGVLIPYKYIRFDTQKDIDNVKNQKIIETSGMPSASEFFMSISELKKATYRSVVDVSELMFDSIQAGEASYDVINRFNVVLNTQEKYKIGTALFLGDGKGDSAQGILTTQATNGTIAVETATSNVLTPEDLFRSVFALKPQYRQGIVNIFVPSIAVAQILAGEKAFGGDGQYKTGLFAEMRSRNINLIEVPDVFFDSEGTNLFNGTDYVGGKPAFIICNPQSAYRLIRGLTKIEGFENFNWVDSNGVAQRCKRLIRTSHVGGELLVKESCVVGLIKS